MITLTAATATLIYRANKPIVVTLLTDSTTVTRIAKAKTDLTESATMGYGLTAYTPLIARLRPDDEIWAISTVTPNITILGILGEDWIGVAPKVV